MNDYSLALPIPVYIGLVIFSIICIIFVIIDKPVDVEIDNIYSKMSSNQKQQEEFEKQLELYTKIEKLNLEDAPTESEIKFYSLKNSLD